MDVNEPERLSNITLSQTQIKVKEQLVVRNGMDVNEPEILSNISLGHKLLKRSIKLYLLVLFLQKSLNRTCPEINLTHCFRLSDILCNNGIFLRHTNLICQHNVLTTGYSLDRSDCAALCGITVECQGLCFNNNGSISCIFIPEPAINLYHASVKKNTWKYFEIIQAGMN